MIIKKFTGKTEAEATAAAKKELGPNAVVMNVKEQKKGGIFGFFSRKEYEVTAAVEEVNDKVTSIKAPTKTREKAVTAESAPKTTGSLGTEAATLTLSGKTITASEAEKAKLEKNEKASESAESQDSIEKKLESIQSLITKQLEKTGEKTSDNKSEENKDKDEKKDKEPDEGDEKSRFLKLIHDTLIDNEVDEKYVNDLLDEIGKIQKPDLSIDFLLVNIYQKMILNLGEPALIEKKGEKAETVFFLGPTGVGKTTTIAKIASDFCVEKKVDVALITTDTYRVKAAEQLRTYADILGIPFRIVYTVEDMESALTEFEDYDYIFIDTAGHSPRNKELFEDQERFIALAKKKLNVEIYLVLSVTTKYRDLLKTADLYTHSGDFRMIFTKLDETDALGSILNMKLNTGADLSYITDGQDVPDDFSIFNAQKTVRLLLGGKA